jgi:hypothetical protein
LTAISPFSLHVPRRRIAPQDIQWSPLYRVSVEPERDFTHIAVVAEDKNSIQTLQRVFPSGQIVQILTKDNAMPPHFASRQNADASAAGGTGCL